MNRTARIVHLACGLAVATGLASTSASAGGGLEQFISFQGRLTGSNGQPIADGLHVLDFFVYDAASGGTLIGSVLDVTVFASGGDGVVSTPFGPADPSWFAGSPRYLGLTVDDTDDNPEGDELGRIQLTAVPSALMAWGLAPGILLNVDDASIKDTLAVANGIGIGIPATAGIPIYARQSTGASPIVAAFEASNGINNVNFAGIGSTNPDGWSTRLNFFDHGVGTNSMSVLASGKIIFSGNGQTPYGNISFTNDGRIGIGTENPAGKLHVYQSGPPGSTLATFETFNGSNELYFRGSGPLGESAYTARFNFMTDGVYKNSMSVFTNGKIIFSDTSTQYGGVVITPTGKLSIGDANPLSAFQILSAGGGALENTAKFASPGCGPSASYIHYGPSGDWYIRSANATGKLVLQDTGGNVGIGTDSPQSRLDVNGTTRTKVLQITGGADIAEPFRIACPDGVSAVHAGMVVIIDPDRAGDLRVADTPLDRRVAGIVSGANGVDPGLVLRSEGDAAVDGPHPVAMTGRVWCWCDASHGAIRPGDRLTTSATPGHAMRVSDDMNADGSVIGKAMSALPDDRGLVLVLVNLQ